MPKYTRRFKTVNNSHLLSLNEDNKQLTKEQQVELAYEELEKCNRDTIMEDEMDLDL